MKPEFIITKLIKATFYSWEGLKAAFKSELAFRLELLLLAAGVLAAFVLSKNNIERALMIGSLFLILIVEILNTAFETTIERISHERHELSKKTKDLGSASVFLALINAVVVWALILAG